MGNFQLIFEEKEEESGGSFLLKRKYYFCTFTILKGREM